MNKQQIRNTLRFIKQLYPGENPVPLHAPRFLGNEKKYLGECIDSTLVSYVGGFVTDFEEHIKRLTGVRNAVAIVSGTSAVRTGDTSRQAGKQNEKELNPYFLSPLFQGAFLIVFFSGTMFLERGGVQSGAAG